MPSENVLSLAKSRGMPIENWLYHLIPEWKLYWLERNILRCWDSTFWNHAKKEWEKVDKSRMYRETTSNKITINSDIADVPIKLNGQTHTIQVPVETITPQKSIEIFHQQEAKFNLK